MTSHEQIEGWFDFDDIYLQMIKSGTNNSHFVEVGSWLDEDLTIWVQNGIIRALLQKKGEKYKSFADNDFIYSFRGDTGKFKLVNEN